MKDISMKDFDSIRQEVMNGLENKARHIYNKGYEDGYKCASACNRCESNLAEHEYNRGLEDAWKAARKAFKYYQLDELSDFFSFFSASEAVAIIKKHEDEKDKIEQLKYYEDKQEQEEKCCKTCLYKNKNCDSDDCLMNNHAHWKSRSYNEKIKVGSKVRTIKDKDHQEDKLFPIGTIGMVKHVYGNCEYPYSVYVDKDFWYYSADMLELIEDEDEIKVGDEVRSLLNNCKGIIIEAHKTKDNDTSVQIFWLDKNCCSIAYYNDHTYVRTGRNLPYLLEVINMMEGSVTDADRN